MLIYPPSNLKISYSPKNTALYKQYIGYIRKELIRGKQVCGIRDINNYLFINQDRCIEVTIMNSSRYGNRKFLRNRIYTTFNLPLTASERKFFVLSNETFRKGEYLIPLTHTKEFLNDPRNFIYHMITITVYSKLAHVKLGFFGTKLDKIE